MTKKLTLNSPIHFFRCLLATMLLLVAFPVASIADTGSGISAFLSGSNDDDFLPPEKAFQLTIEPQDAETVVAHFEIAPGHYLYRDRIHFTLPEGSPVVISPNLPQGDMKHDANFGDTVVYHHSFNAILRVAGYQAAQGPLAIKATYQGCSEKGLCYAPIKHDYTINMLDAGAAAKTATTSNSASSDAANTSPDENSQVASILKSGRWWLVVSVFFVAGLLLSLTPCVLPMIPILSSIIVGANASNAQTKTTPNRAHSFNLSLTYTLGMAASYTLAGIAAGLSGQLFSNALQNPWVLGASALVFVLLALSMFGFYELALPSSLEEKLVNTSNRLKGGKMAAVFVMGALSALIVSPCVAAPLAAALLYISQTHQVVLGGVALFSLAMGMGVPLLLVGASAGAILPKTGAWMNAVRNTFGVVMLGMAIYIIGPLVPITVQMALWAPLLIIPAIFMHALDNLPPHANAWMKFFKGIGIILLLVGASLLIGALSGATSPFQPLAMLNAQAATTNHSSPELRFERIKSNADLDARLADTQGKLVMLDFYADWCVACKEMERLTFTDARVQDALNHVTRLQVDVTQNTADDLALLKRFGLFGPPGIVFFDAHGQALAANKIIGFENADQFIKHIPRATVTAMRQP